jgi:oligopeptide transport system substrate-binding protein
MKKNKILLLISISILVILFSVTFIAGQRTMVLKFNNGTEPQTLDPAVMTGVPEFRLAMQLFEGLTVYNPRDLTAMPGVAEKWDVSKDGITYTFYLRKDAKWSDGTPIDANTFKYSWLRALAPETAADYAYQLWYIKNGLAYTNGEVGAEKVGITVKSNYVLEVTLDAPTPFFVDLMSFQTYMPTPQHVVEKYGDDKWYLQENIVTNGAFALTEWKPQEIIKMAPNKNYWDRRKVRLTEIQAYPYEDSNTALEMFLNNELDWITQVPVERIDEMKAHKDYHNAAYLGTYYYMFNTEVQPLNNTKVREALFLAIDRDHITRYITKAGQIPAFQFVPPNMPGYKYKTKYSDDYQANLKRAKLLLKEAGYADGQGFPELTILYNTLESHKKIAEGIQQMWKQELGINVSIENQEWKVYLQKRDEGDYQIARAGWIGDYVDPNTFMDMWVTGGGNNDTGWSNARYDELIDKCKYEQNIKKRYQYFEEAETILMDELPILPIYFYVNTFMLKDYVSGFYENILDNHPLKEVRVRR